MQPSEKKSTTEGLILFEQTMQGKNYSPPFIQACVGDIRQFIEWLKTRRVDWDIPSSIQHIDIGEFLNHLAREQASEQTRQRQHAVIRGFLKFLKHN